MEIMQSKFRLGMDKKSKTVVLFLSWNMDWEIYGYSNFNTVDVPGIQKKKKSPPMENRGCVMGFSWRTYEQGHRLPRVENEKKNPKKKTTCFYSSCTMTVFEEKCLASEPFV